MTDEVKPSKEYLYALTREANDLLWQGLQIKFGFIQKTPEERAEWMKHKNWVQDEIKRVRRLIA